MPEQVPSGEYIRKYCQLAGAEAYLGGRPPTACYRQVAFPVTQSTA